MAQKRGPEDSKILAGNALQPGGGHTTAEQDRKQPGKGTRAPQEALPIKQLALWAILPLDIFPWHCHGAGVHSWHRITSLLPYATLHVTFTDTSTSPQRIAASALF